MNQRSMEDESDCNFRTHLSVCHYNSPKLMIRFSRLTLLVVMLSGAFTAFTCDHSAGRPPQKSIDGGQGTKSDDPEPNLDGIVEVSFKIDNLGKVQILNINSTSPQLADYVIKRLGKIQLEQGNSQIGKVIKYRFVFKKQA